MGASAGKRGQGGNRNLEGCQSLGGDRRRSTRIRRNAWRYGDGGVVWVDAREIAPPTALGLLQRALSRLVPGADVSDPVFGLTRHLAAAPGLIVLDNLETLPEAEFAERFLLHEKRLNEQVTIAIRGMQAADFTDPGLGLIKRIILEKVNRALGKTLVREAVFSEFSFIER